MVEKVAFLEKSKQLGSVFQDVEPSKSKWILRKGAKFLELKRSMQFSKGTARPVKIRERKGPSQGVLQRSEPMLRTKLEDRSEKKP